MHEDADTPFAFRYCITDVSNGRSFDKAVVDSEEHFSQGVQIAVIDPTGHVFWFSKCSWRSVLLILVPPIVLTAEKSSEFFDIRNHDWFVSADGGI
jgi:hypothetical protein